MDSRTDTRDSAVSTLLCNLENYNPKTGIQKKKAKKKTELEKQYLPSLPYIPNLTKLTPAYATL